MKLVEQDQLDLDVPMAEILKDTAFPSLSVGETIHANDSGSLGPKSGIQILVTECHWIFFNVSVSIDRSDHKNLHSVGSEMLITTPG